MNKIEELIQQLCPDGVEFKKLGDVCEIKTGKGITKKDSSDIAPYPIISGGREPMGYYDNYNRSENTVTISRVGANSGHVSFINTKFYLNDKCFSTIPIAQFINQINSKFLFYYLKTNESNLTGLQSEGGVPTINTTKVSNISIPIPPLPIQQEIVNILDKFTHLEIELEAELDARKKQYEYYRNELLNYAGKDFEWKTLGEETKVYTGGEAPTNCVKGLFPNEIYKYPIFANGLEVYGYTDNYKINKDAVTISSIGANTGTIYYRKAFFTPIIRLKVLIPRSDNLLARYLFYYLSSTKIYSKKSSVPNLNADDVKKIKVPIPPLSEQERIVGILDKFDALVNDKSFGLPAELQARRKQYEYYRGKLLDFKDMNNG